MERITEQSEWENYDLSFFDGLNLYLAEKRIDYGKNEVEETGLVNTNGEWVYKCAKNEFIGLRHHFYGSKAAEKSNRALRLFTIT